ncbi:hypothetical protein NSND_62882 [Nitrospira sp. ND1]|jgi:hypothetical protein|uniref:hypothetical protein n=1 Tax=Nitrospira sp. ND1 TaxID=1658518 RepID=UPI0009BB09B9|nr:hypothetical protein [Nitrospira sp. ND1]SLM45449.1 hypothetical protein NSND_62882 [Nitrospira sp. ND1]
MTQKLLSFLRDGLAATTDQQPGAAAQLRPALSITTALTSNGMATRQVQSPPFHVLGPGDVISLNPERIIVRSPTPDSLLAAENEFAWIDFDRADFPWLFTPFGPVGPSDEPANPDKKTRLTPWLCLIVLAEQDGISLEPAIPNWQLTLSEPFNLTANLPDLKQSHTWAHAQVPTPSREEEIESNFRRDPQSTRSRLICPRKLRERTRYLACVVPVFKAGVLTGLGKSLNKDGDISLSDDKYWAWTEKTSLPFILPVYVHWRFTTGEAGGFEDLVRRLKSQTDVSELGRRPLDASRPGDGIPEPTSDPKPVILQQDGCLVPDGQKLDKVNEGLSEAIAAKLNQPGVLCPPSYGRWHAASPVGSAARPRNWLEDLNLNATRRVAAALGTAVVQRHQEEFMAAAWDQAGEILRANQELRLSELARAASVSLHTHRLHPLATGSGGLALLAFAAPALSRITFEPPKTFRGLLKDSCLSLLALSGAFQKLLRPNGPIQRKIARRRVKDQLIPRDEMIQLSEGMQLGPIFSIGEIYRILAADGLPDQPPHPPSGARIAQASRLMLRPRLPLSNTRVTRVPDRLPQLRPLHSRDPLDTLLNDLLDLDRRNARLPCIPLPDALAQKLFVALDPKVTIPNRVRRRLSIPKTESFNAVSKGLEPIMVAPRLPIATSKFLLQIGQDWLLPGIGHLDPESLSFFNPNRSFIEAFLVGINHEMGRELLWRGFPTDQRGTVFDSFWQVDDRIIPAMHPMHQWKGALGSHLASQRIDLTVVLMRGEIVRRFPAATVFLQEAKLSGGLPSPDPDVAAIMPSFSQLIDQDMRLLGFPRNAAALRGDGHDPVHPHGYFLAFQEEPKALRFGPPPNLPLNSLLSYAANSYLQVQGDSVALATASHLRPVRLYFHASKFLASPPPP